MARAGPARCHFEAHIGISAPLGPTLVVWEIDLGRQGESGPPTVEGMNFASKKIETMLH